MPGGQSTAKPSGALKRIASSLEPEGSQTTSVEILNTGDEFLTTDPRFLS